MGWNRRLFSIKVTLCVTVAFSGVTQGAQWVISGPVDIKWSDPIIQEKPASVAVDIKLGKESATAMRSANHVPKTQSSSFGLWLKDQTTGISTGDGFDDFDDFDEFDDYSAFDEFKNWETWVKPFYDSGNRNEVSDVKGFRTKTAGFAMGADAEMDKKTRVGAAFTFDKTSVDGDDKQYMKLRSMLGSFYTRWNNRLYFFNTIASMGRTHSDTERTIEGLKYAGKFDASTWSFNVTAGKHFRYQGWNIDPSAIFNYGSVGFEDYLEKAESGETKKVKPSKYEFMEFGLGLKVDRSYWGRTIVRRGRYKPEFSLTGFYEINSNGTSVKSRVPTGPDSFVITSPKRDKFRLMGELGVTVSTYRRWEFKAGYRFNWSANYNSHGLTAQAHYKF